MLSIGAVKIVESHSTYESKHRILISGVSIEYPIGAICESLLKEKAKKECGFFFFHSILLLADYLPLER